MVRLLALLLFAPLAGCWSPREAFVCASAVECQAGGASGTCEPNGYCSYADGSCGAGRRYGGGAGGGLAGICVGDEPGGDGGAAVADAFVLPDALVITGCESHEDCAPLTDACGTGACDTATGVCEKIAGNEGDACDAPSCGGFGECGGFDSTCDTSGSQSRSCTPKVCASGSCVAGTPYADSQGCSRGTDGISCGGVVCSDWSGCNWETECDESATQSRTCYPQVCGGGSCGNGAGSTETLGCSRDTDGQACNGGCPFPPGVCELGNCLCT